MSQRTTMRPKHVKSEPNTLQGRNKELYGLGRPKPDHFSLAKIFSQNLVSKVGSDPSPSRMIRHLFKSVNTVKVIWTLWTALFLRPIRIQTEQKSRKIGEPMTQRINCTSNRRHGARPSPQPNHRLPAPNPIHTPPRRLRTASIARRSTRIPGPTTRRHGRPRAEAAQRR